MKGLIDPIIEHSENNKPLLGICLGMQMMLEKSYEFEEVDGLGIIKGKVIKIPNLTLIEINIKFLILAGMRYIIIIILILCCLIICLCILYIHIWKR